MLVLPNYALMPSICIDPQPMGLKKITKYLYEEGVCNKMVFLSLAPPYTYFDTEEECVRRCVNNTRL